MDYGWSSSKQNLGGWVQLPPPTSYEYAPMLSVCCFNKMKNMRKYKKDISTEYIYHISYNIIEHRLYNRVKQFLPCLEIHIDSVGNSFLGQDSQKGIFFSLFCPILDKLRFKF